MNISKVYLKILAASFLVMSSVAHAAFVFTNNAWPDLDAGTQGTQIPFDIGPNLAGHTANLMAAINYYNQFTNIRFIPTPAGYAGDRFVIDESIDPNETVSRTLFSGINTGSCSNHNFNPTPDRCPITLAQNAGQWVIVHELLHGLGFQHEHKRGDSLIRYDFRHFVQNATIWYDLWGEPFFAADSFVTPTPNTYMGSSNAFTTYHDYLKFYGTNGQGDFDIFSNMQYRQNIITVDTYEFYYIRDLLYFFPLEMFSFRILLKDQTTAPVVPDWHQDYEYDNLALNADSLGNIGIDTFLTSPARNWLNLPPHIDVNAFNSALWSIERGTIGFRLKNHLNNEYLWKNGNILQTASAPAIFDSTFEWRLDVFGPSFKIKNSGSSQIICANGSNLTLSTSCASSFPGWLIQPMVNEWPRNSNGDFQRLSAMDSIRLHQFSGSLFRLQARDATPSTLDNTTLQATIDGSGEFSYSHNTTPNVENDELWDIIFNENGDMVLLHVSTDTVLARTTTDWQKTVLIPKNQLDSNGIPAVEWSQAAWRFIPRRDHVIIKAADDDLYLKFNPATNQLTLIFTFPDLDSQTLWEVVPDGVNMLEK